MSNSLLSLSPGEISSLFVDGLFALDEQGLLFPGVTVPEYRLHIAGMEPIGYERTGPLEDARNSMVASPNDLPKDRRVLSRRLEAADNSLDAAILRQRMLSAKLGALRTRCHHLAEFTEQDRVSADALLAAAEAITTAVEAATKPVL